MGALSTSPPKARKSGDRHIFWRQPNNLATARISGDKFWRRQNLICVEFILYVGISIKNSTHEEVFHVKFNKKVLAASSGVARFLATARLFGGRQIFWRFGGTSPHKSPAILLLPGEYVVHYVVTVC